MSLQQTQESFWANATRSPWTESKTNRLIELFHEGKLSCAGMAREIGDVSRNAVIGKLSRLGLSVPMEIREKFREESRLKRVQENIARQAELGLRFEKVKSEKAKSGEQIQARKSAAAERRARFECLEIVDLPPEESAVAVSFFDLTNDTCRWPLGDPRDLQSMKFCGAKPLKEYVYCRRHCLQSYRLPSRETRRPTVKPSRLTAPMNW